VDQVRVDRWLSAARLFKSRTQAGQGCQGGHVKVNGANAKPHQLLRAGDEVRVQRGERVILVDVVALAEKRLSPQEARDLYDDRSPPPPPRKERVASRDPGAGRPSKRDRRALRRLRGR
jgi:ribosome-associated heat shock protein Hsp15